jgi:murein L,D-transpeptidase YcbB/YkuD
VKPTPVWGKALTRAVEEFQREHGLGVDGVVGANTWRVLDRVPMPA